MTTISATQFRKHLFEYLDKIEMGETIILKRHKREIARINPYQQIDWRDRMPLQPEVLVTRENLMAPIKDVWEDKV